MRRCAGGGCGAADVAPGAVARRRLEGEGADPAGARKQDPRRRELEDALRLGSAAAGRRPSRQLVRSRERRARERRRRLGPAHCARPAPHGALRGRGGSVAAAADAARGRPRRLPATRLDRRAQRSPTPTGRFHVTDQISGRKWRLGCCIVVLSGNQPRLPAGWSGGDRLAIHGRPSPREIFGGPTSAGCLHATEQTLRALARLPLGTPVVIHP
ncbi:MAG TPA: L,D-transpeptidase [Gaiella sp.]|nr:L,D-transpeptidase [Gaiella sp.]